MRTSHFTGRLPGPRPPRTQLARLAGVLAAAATWTAVAATGGPAAFAAPASTGAGAGGGLCVPQSISPGTARLAGKLTVVNTGSGRETIGLTAGPVPPPPPLHPPLSRFAKTAVTPPLAWIIAVPSSVTLDPGKSAPITVTLDIPSGARPGGYQAWVSAAPASPSASSEGTSITLGGGAAVETQFGVSAPPPACNTTPAPVPWWATYPARDAPEPAGWSFGGPPNQPFVWTYKPSTAATSASEPPGWAKERQMQVWLYGGWDFVLDHTAGWQYLSTAGPEGVVEYAPPGGKLPSWALQLAAGRPYTIPGTTGSSTADRATAAPAVAAQPDAQASGTSSSLGPVLLLAAAAVGALWVAGRRIRRRTGRTR